MDTMKITEHGHKTTGPFLLWLTPDHLLLKTSNFTSSRPGLFPDSPNDILGCCTQVVHKFFNLVFLLSFLMPMWYYYTYTQPSNHVHFIHLIPQACQVVNLIPPSFFFFYWPHHEACGISVSCCCSSLFSCCYFWPRGLQHASLPCPSLSPGVCSDSCQLSRWCCLAISSSATLFSFSFNLSQHQDLFQWVGSSHQGTKVLELQLQEQSFQWMFRVYFL